MASGQPLNDTMHPHSQTTAIAGKDVQAGDEKWDEQELEKAMDTLKELHIKLRNLRTTMPRILAPLAKKHETPESLFQEFSVAKNTANLQVQQFRKLVEGPESTKVLAYANKSRAARPKGIKPWRVTDHPNWASSNTPA